MVQSFQWGQLYGNFVGFSKILSEILELSANNLPFSIYPELSLNIIIEDLIASLGRAHRTALELKRQELRVIQLLAKFRGRKSLPRLQDFLSYWIC